MKEVKKTEGNYITYTTTESSIIFGNEDLMLNLKNRERDDAVLIDICEDSDGCLVIGTFTGFRYVAQIEIPARKYTEVEVPAKEAPAPMEGEGPVTERIPVPFNIDECTIYLFGGVRNEQ